MKMCFGNMVGFRYAENVSPETIFGYRYGAFILELTEDVPVGTPLGETTAVSAISMGERAPLPRPICCACMRTSSSPCMPATSQRPRSGAQLHLPHAQRARGRGKVRKAARAHSRVPRHQLRIRYRQGVCGRGRGAGDLRHPQPHGGGSRALRADVRRQDAGSADRVYPGRILGRRRAGRFGQVHHGVLPRRARERAGHPPSGRATGADGRHLQRIPGAHQARARALRQDRRYGRNCPTLTYNNIARHQSRIVRVRVASVQSPWLSLVEAGEVFSVPISHGEGKFVASPRSSKSSPKTGRS